MPREICSVSEMFSCPKPECDGEDPDPEPGEGHTTDDYACTCPECGLDFGVDREYGVGWYKSW